MAQLQLPEILVTPGPPPAPPADTNPNAVGAGMGDVYVPASPGGPQGAAAGQDNGAGMGDAYTPQAPSSTPPGGTPEQPVNAATAAGAGAVDAATFGTAPAIAGLSAASGMDLNPPADAGTTSAPGVGDVPTSTSSTAAVAKTLASPVVGAARVASGEAGAAQAYDAARQDAEAHQEQLEQAYPKSYMAGAVGASLATLPITGGAGIAERGVPALTRIARAARAGAIGGGAFGAGKATSKGGTPLDILEGAAGGAAVGGAVGGVAGSAAEGVGHIASRVSSLVRAQRNPEQEAARIASEAFQGGPSQQAKVASRLQDTEALIAGDQAGTDARLADFAGEPAAARLRAAANRSPEAREYIRDFVGSRFAQQSQRVADWIRGQFGFHDTPALRERLRQIGRGVLDPLYQRAYKLGDQGIANKELLRLAGAPDIRNAAVGAITTMRNRGIVKGFRSPQSVPFVWNAKGVASLRKTANGNTIYPNLAYWDHVVRNLNGHIDELERSGNREAMMNAVQLKNALLEQLDNLPGGVGDAYKAARGGAHRFLSGEDALDAGSNFVTDNGIDNRAMARALSKMTDVERRLFGAAFAQRLANLIEGNRDGVNILNSIYLNSPRARQRIQIALGRDGATQFEALMRIETMVDRVRQALGNSTTAQQLNDHSLLSGGAGAALAETFHGAFNPVFIIAGALVMGGQQMARHIDEQVATRVAQMLLSKDPTVVNRGLQIVTRNPVFSQALRYGSSVGTRQLIQFLGPSGTAAGAVSAYEHFRPEEPHQAVTPNDQDYYDSQNAGAGVP